MSLWTLHISVKKCCMKFILQRVLGLAMGNLEARDIYILICTFQIKLRDGNLNLPGQGQLKIKIVARFKIILYRLFFLFSKEMKTSYPTNKLLNEYYSFTFLPLFIIKTGVTTLTFLYKVKIH